MEPRPRPDPGKVTIRELRIPVCRGCGYRIDETGLCSYECDYDGDHRPAEAVIHAVYRETMEFLRDE